MERVFGDEDYRVVEDLLRKYRNGGDTEDLGILLEKIKPLVISTCRHYFGFYNEDLLQSGAVCCIESIQKFDFGIKNIRYLGYQKEKLEFFYLGLKRETAKISTKEVFSGVDGSYLLEDSGYTERGYDIVECQSFLNVLNEKERYIIEKNIFHEESLLDISKTLGISYDYAKELKRKAISKLRKLSKNTYYEEGA